MYKKISVIIGGGAAGVFGALTCAQFSKDRSVILLEKTRQLLAKVRISGGGRCNVTHAAFDPKTLITHYPRGSKELLGPFYVFQPRDTISWFESRGVKLKTEEDGRMFPITDSSETISDCLLTECRKLKIELRIEQKITSIEKTDEGFLIHMETGSPLFCDTLLLATGSSPQGLSWARALGHSIVPLVPSLFTFNVPSSPLLDLSGIAVPDAILSLKECGLKQRGPLLLTHWGFSGPAALKLSAWAARILHDTNYHAELLIHWLPNFSSQEIYEKLISIKNKKPLKNLENENLFSLPLNLWKKFLQISSIPHSTTLSNISNHALRILSQTLTQSSFPIAGKTTYKQEFVTCGGIQLKEVDFQTMQSRLVKGLYFAGEILDIDGVTGGFNFQNAWTTSWIAGKAMSTL